MLSITLQSQAFQRHLTISALTHFLFPRGFGGVCLWSDLRSVVHALPVTALDEAGRSQNSNKIKSICWVKVDFIGWSPMSSHWEYLDLSVSHCLKLINLSNVPHVVQAKTDLYFYCWYLMWVASPIIQTDMCVRVCDRVNVLLTCLFALH